MLVNISARTLTFPRYCACCGADPDTSSSASYTRVTGKRVIKTDTRSWDFPYCTHCVAHAKAWQSSGAGATITWVIGIPLTVLGFIGNIVGGLMLGVMTIVFASLFKHSYRNSIKQKCTPSCATPGWAVRYHGWDGSIQSFEVLSRFYAVELARANMRKLVSVNRELELLLQGSVLPAPSIKPRQVSTESVAAVDAPRVQDKGELLLQWIDRIESMKGPVARRNAVSKALAELSDPDARHHLLLEASRIEVRAVFDKVDSLKTPSAKKRHLQAAIEQIRQDDIPDELQASEIALLQHALDELESGHG